MDAKAVAEAARVGVGTLNVWVQRGLIPGITVGARGRQRDFDLNTATHIALMVELVRVGLPANAASSHAREFGTQRKRWLLLSHYWLPEGADVHDAAALKQLQEAMASSAALWPFDSEEELPATLKRFGDPAVYTVVNVERIAGIVKRAAEEWERERGA